MTPRWPAFLRAAALTSALLLLACDQSGAGAQDASRVQPQTRTSASSAPVIVELFQSQGCSSCPPANAYLNRIADRGDVVALSFAVTYWDQLGWKDTFAKPAFTKRQRDYARLGVGQVATPEMVVNGSVAVVGSNQVKFDRAIAEARFGLDAPGLSVDADKVRVGASASKVAARIWLVRYDPKVRNVPIHAGENFGRTLPHRGVVRELVDLGSWNGKALSLDLPKARESGLRGVVLVQREPLGAIITARRLPG
ncbi:MAG: DUF1223 domain-containing protein [Novosphingobium sp.]|nr:DUF1223 domain-containing protein [Novosphingobium sp.]